MLKKLLTVFITLCLCVNVSFAFDPYADEEVEKKSYKKLYYGIHTNYLKLKNAKFKKSDLKEYIVFNSVS